MSKLIVSDSRFAYATVSFNGQIIEVDPKVSTPDLLIEKSTGRVAASVSGYARLVGLNKSTISRRLTSEVSHKMGAEEAQIHTPSGVQGVYLIWEDTIAQWVIGDNPTLAKAMLEAGLRVFIYQLCGYTVKVENHVYTGDSSKCSTGNILETSTRLLELFERQLKVAELKQNQRLIHFYTNALATFTQAKILNDCQAVLPTETPKIEREFEGVVDVAIRKGWKLPKNFEGSLGRFVRKHASELLTIRYFDDKGNPVYVTDERFSQCSDKIVPANMYPYKHPKIESLVKQYLESKGLI